MAQIRVFAGAVLWACRDKTVSRAGKVRAETPFPRSSKLLKHGDFQRVYKNGKRHFAGHLTAFYSVRAQTSAEATVLGPRIGITVGRMLGGAVQRNRIKRRMREAVRLNLGQISAPVDVVINPKKSALEVDFAQLRDEVAKALHVVQKSTTPRREQGK